MPDKYVYLRLGALPPGGRSRRWHNGIYEKGVSVFRGRYTPGEGFAVEIPLAVPADLRLQQVFTLVGIVLDGRLPYLAEGREMDDRGGAGEPLLEDAEAELLSHHERVALPEWLGSVGEGFADGWNESRRVLGPKVARVGGPRGCWDALGERAVHLLLEAWEFCAPEGCVLPGRWGIPPEDRERGVRALVGSKGDNAPFFRLLRESESEDAVGGAPTEVYRLAEEDRRRAEELLRHHEEVWGSKTARRAPAWQPSGHPGHDRPIRRR